MNKFNKHTKATDLSDYSLLVLFCVSNFFSLLKQTFALTSICSIFNNDAHNIISQKGLEILNNKNYE